jgi:hypothetical protein
MSDVKTDDPTPLEDHGEMNSEPIRARTDEGLRDDERRGENRTVLTPLDDKQADAIQEAERLYDELAAHEKERKPVNTVQTWEETGKSDLPVDQSSTAKDRPDVTKA